MNKKLTTFLLVIFTTMLLGINHIEARGGFGAGFGFGFLGGALATRGYYGYQPNGWYTTGYYPSYGYYPYGYYGYYPYGYYGTYGYPGNYFYW